MKQEFDVSVNRSTRSESDRNDTRTQTHSEVQSFRCRSLVSQKFYRFIVPNV